MREIPDGPTSGSGCSAPVLLSPVVASESLPPKAPPSSNETRGDEHADNPSTDIVATHRIVSRAVIDVSLWIRFRGGLAWFRAGLCQGGVFVCAGQQGVAHHQARGEQRPDADGSEREARNDGPKAAAVKTLESVEVVLHGATAAIGDPTHVQRAEADRGKRETGEDQVHDGVGVRR